MLGTLKRRARASSLPAGFLVCALLAFVGRDASAPAAPTEGVRASRAVTILSCSTGDGPLAVAFLDSARLLAVTAGEIEVLKLSDSAASVTARLALPLPRRRVRAPAALLAPDETGAVAWILTNGIEEALLVEVEQDRIVEHARASVLPWPGSSSGLRFREGTNWIEGDVPGLGTGPFLALSRGEPARAVTPEGVLQSAASSTQSGPVVGGTFAPLWPGAFVSSTANPPGVPDAVVVFEEGEEGPSKALMIPVDGAVRALAAQETAKGARLVASVEAPGGCRVLLVSLERRSP